MDRFDTVGIDEGRWEDFANSEQRQIQIVNNRVSYAWDALIERFASHALSGTQYFSMHPALETTEQVLRFMAAEPRLNRRVLAKELIDAHRANAD